MSTEVSPLATVQEQIKDRIRAEFTNLIPDEMWAKMVQSVVTDFITDKNEYGRMVESPVKTLIRKELETLARAKLSSVLSELNAPQWINGQTSANEALQKFIAENTPLILASIQKSTIDMVVTAAVNNLQNSFR